MSYLYTKTLASPGFGPHFARMAKQARRYCHLWCAFMSIILDGMNEDPAARRRSHSRRDVYAMIGNMPYTEVNTSTLCACRSRRDSIVPQKKPLPLPNFLHISHSLLVHPRLSDVSAAMRLPYCEAGEAQVRWSLPTRELRGLAPREALPDIIGYAHHR